jgi:hypothetical protein
MKEVSEKRHAEKDVRYMSESLMRRDSTTCIRKRGSICAVITELKA